ncbi:hypothetical protein [Mycobacteroides abscessus]|uniref:hypothetical protein n=1 Tax=Mycobacteroides abscessus TaxID=36809 RepID=UPI00092635C7|nr:hypothetical protein [Mycobacteroides abscessus]DAZ90314.1 TPA_asm: hypothetical protein PROPHIFSQJ01-1_28 [Mycobacterium phage prophiFSQJ01-1]SII40621.1 Uncharacterised protein [Mycobacteroides abscessus subsp. abscessus]SIK14611.1 Uncharacterised protein [Mycobacteroides abscessus subsp. abscessus]SIN25139.1 Uncharacterised protein [Mycobacteroides abscessus subsp. abscessus]SLI51815.1 Uncharacterised protein [Mycobacteroides abscessus subsp. abscessus]
MTVPADVRASVDQWHATINDELDEMIEAHIDDIDNVHPDRATALGMMATRLTMQSQEMDEKELFEFISLLVIAIDRLATKKIADG